MDTLSINVFQQARMLVAQADREMAELALRFEEAFPFSREEKDELRPMPVDAFDQWSIELAPKGGVATFLMTPGSGGAWSLDVVEKAQGPVHMRQFHTGHGNHSTRGRLRAARVVTAIGDWLHERGQLPAADMETVLVLEANARVEIKTESRPKASAQAQAHQDERALPPQIQPRWLDLVPGAEQEPAPEGSLVLAASEKESRPQVAFHLGKIFGF